MSRLPVSVEMTHLDSSPQKSLDESWAKLKTWFDEDRAGFFHSPVNNELSQIDAVEAMATEVRAQEKIKDVVLVGIGGSSLGPKAVLAALERKIDQRFRFHFAENPDPEFWITLTEKIHPESTLICGITKSGGTYETMALLQLAMEWLGKERWQENVVAITDPVDGHFRKFVDANQLRCLSIAPSIGGRFSAFTPVGLFFAALAGLNIRDFMQGAADARAFCLDTPPEKNPLLLLGAKLVDHVDRYPIHVFQPYSSLLKETSAWFVQLWGESLGKDLKGFTPVGALGAVDQHSILQLLRDGPNDKVTFFVDIAKRTTGVKIPPLPGLPISELLSGHELGKLLDTESQAIQKVLSGRDRPVVRLELPELDESSMGALLFELCVLTAFAGFYWELNPFDQPGVEEGKILIREALH